MEQGSIEVCIQTSEPTAANAVVNAACQPPIPTVSVVIDCPPPAYCDMEGQQQEGAASSSLSASSVDTIRAELPPYDTAATLPMKLPSYDESEKIEKGEAPVGVGSGAHFFLWRPPHLLFGRQHGGSAASGGDEEACSAAPAVQQQRLTHAQLARLVIGTDVDFFCCFLIAFVFNWVGLVCTLCCLTVTVAGRSGAMAGFGLSVVKWALLVMHQSRFAQQKLGLLPTPAMDSTGDDASVLGMDIDDNHYFIASCWLIVVLGLLCFLQGVVHYFKAKRCARDYQWLRNRYWGVPAAVY